jgi:ribokinase
MKNEILGLGEVVVDWVAIVDHFPEPDEKIDSKSQSLFSGGVTANYVVAASRLGAKTGFFGAVGDDEYADFLKKDFVEEKVDDSFLIKKTNKKTPVNFIFVVEKNGEKVIIQSPYMYSTVPEITDIDEKIFDGIQLLHSSGIYHELTLEVFISAKEKGITISFDLEKQIAIRGVEKIRELLKYVDILLPNKAGAMELTKTTKPLEAARTFLSWGVKQVVITLGEKGCLAVNNTQVIEIAAFPSHSVDTTGAGDTFCAAFGFAFVLKKMALEDACNFANAAAALKIQKLGARTGMPSFIDTIEFLKKNNIVLKSFIK